MPRLKTSVIAVLSTLLLCLPIGIALADDAAEPAGERGEILHFFKDAENKLNDLAAATPEAKYAWSPGKGVRTTGEVFMHVASANYGIPSFWGVKPPEGFNFETHEKSLTKKADIQKDLAASFTYMEQALMAMSDADLEKPAEFFGMKTTVGAGYLLVLSHSHEHLGQSIAYARMNGIVPPWTARQEAAMKAEAAKKAGAK